MKPSKFMRKHSTGKLLANPPKARKAKRVRVKKARPVKARRVKPTAAAFRARRLGEVVAVEYRHAADGRLYRHEFKSADRGVIGFSPDGKALVIAGRFRVQEFIR